MRLAIVVALLTAVTSAVFLYAFLRSGLALRLAADRPNERSLHTRITPRVGGMTVFPVAFVFAVIADPSHWHLPLAALSLLALSFADDRFGLPIGLRFIAHALVAMLMLVSSGHFGFIAVVLLTPVLVWGTNLYNFMDGSDGLAGGMAVIGFSAYAVASPITSDIPILAISIVGASGAFLLFNFPPARVFMGDAGSIPLGFLAAAMGGIAWQQGIWPCWFPILVFSPFLIDATATLLRRMLCREKFWQAHREHYYQRLILMGWSHRRLALVEYALMLASAGAALSLLQADTSVQYGGLAACAAIYLLLMTLVDRRWREFTYMESRNA